MLKKVIINNLFGTYTHEIDLKEDITIIHGLNGCGKTTVLKILVYLFTKNTESLSQVEFDSIKLLFEEGQELEIERRNTTSKEDGVSTYFRRVRGDNSYYLFFHLLDNGVVSESPTKESIVRILANHNIDNSTYIKKGYSPLFRGLSEEQVVEYLEKSFSSKEINEGNFDLLYRITREYRRSLELSEEIGKFLDLIDVKFISTDRLKVQTSQKSTSYGEENTKIEEKVSISAKQIAERIVRTLQEYGDFSQRTDRTFPFRVLKETHSLEADDILKKLSYLEGRRKHYMSIGILELENEDSIYDIKKSLITDDTRRTLSLYLLDNEKKLEVIEKLSKQISKFKEILDKKLVNKEILFDKTKGFTFRIKKTGKLLDGTQLSSGEQQQLVLLYELIFNTSPKTLVLIDEPELSLHITWQQEFLSDMLDIIRSNSFRLIIATHSPQIINNRWDLTVLLG